MSSHTVSLLALFAQYLIGFYFVFFGFWNIYFWDSNQSILRKHHIPFSNFILWVGVLWEIICGAMIIFGYEIKIAAILLILFTLISINIFLPFWGQRLAVTAKRNFIIYATNLLVTIGALLLLISLNY